MQATGLAIMNRADNPAETEMCLTLVWKRLRRTRHCSRSVARALDQETFKRTLHLEQKRSDRSQRRFVLMLLRSGNSRNGNSTDQALSKLFDVLPKFTRDTDITGWYHDGSVVGVIFTEIGEGDQTTIENVLFAKIATVLDSTLSTEEINEVSLSVRMFPDGCRKKDDEGGFTLYRDLVRNTQDEDRKRNSNSDIFLTPVP